jgi:hypothetical protein
MAIIKMLDVSSIHIQPETGDWLTSNSYHETGDPIVYAKQDYGWFVYTYLDDEVPEDLPEDLKKVLAYARRIKCVWIMLDADGDTIKYLPVYDWTEKGRLK